MGRFVKGDVVVTPFPFSDLQAAKRRPALVVATFTGDDVLLCQITSQAISDSYAIPLRGTDLASGRLAHDSNIRPNRLFTADSNIILYRAGVLKPAKLQEVTAKIIEIVSTYVGSRIPHDAAIPLRTLYSVFPHEIQCAEQEDEPDWYSAALGEECGGKRRLPVALAPPGRRTRQSRRTRPSGGRLPPHLAAKVAS